MAVAEQNINLVRAVYQNGYSRELFVYWFQVKGKTLANEYSLKLAEIVNSIFYNRRDSAFIRLSVSYEGDPNQAIALAESFVQDFYPHIAAVLPQ